MDKEAESEEMIKKLYGLPPFNNFSNLCYTEND